MRHLSSIKIAPQGVAVPREAQRKEVNSNEKQQNIAAIPILYYHTPLLLSSLNFTSRSALPIKPFHFSLKIGRVICPPARLVSVGSGDTSQSLYLSTFYSYKNDRIRNNNKELIQKQGNKTIEKVRQYYITFIP